MATRRRINTGIPSSIGVANPPFERRGCSMPTTSHGYSGSTRLFPWVVAKGLATMIPMSTVPVWPPAT